ncbi:MAG: branched-chain amino acid ABC transporter permease [Rhodobacteraceae bacterium]|nr:branched-chain amino acid ABC transporter permease [Paracoccaceae bacterium]
MDQTRNILYFVGIAALIIITGMVQSWNSALLILNMGLISAVMALGVNLQWGFAGLFNVGVMGFVALGGLAAVLVSTDPVSEAWNAGGLRILFALAVGVGIIGATIIAYRRITATRPRVIAMVTILGLGFFAYRALLDPAVEAVEAVNPALQGNLGGLDLPIILAWPVGGLFAAGAAWIIGKAALGLRSDYLAIATLGISEIIIAILKNEDWLARGVKNVIGLDRPVPKEIDLQESAEFIERASGLGLDPVTASALFVKLNYALLFSVVLIILLIMAQLSLKSPWGRMMRAIRDNETAAAAMGKNVTNRHLQIFILGSAICGMGSYQPLRFTFLIWVMVIVGGSGNNFGAVLGGFLIWFLWVQVEPMSQYLVTLLTAGMAEDNAARLHMMESVAYMRLLTMGLVLLLVLRFSPRGLIPEK